ncbi:MAG TPA: SAM-dependent methyltransferase [Terriglobales bacterium]|nr:SAM-dependent methyltransferase [Terriglobales bacterium]
MSPPPKPTPPAGPAPAAPEPLLLESDRPLSQSLLWQRQRDFYVERGPKAWSEDLVPQYITNNPFLAEIQAGLVAAFLEDCQQAEAGAPALSPAHPLRILDLGAGPGRFACLFLRHLTARLAQRGLAPGSIRYCMADCAPASLAAWRANPYLADFAARGLLDFALYESGQPLASLLAGAAPGALVLIANYLFDSLPQDAFVISAGAISEALLTTRSPQPGAGTTPALSQLQLSWRNVPLRPQRYPDPSWNQILEHYRSRLPAATVLFPTAALQLLEEARRAAAHAPLLLLAADKGYTAEDDLALSQGPPTLEFHGPDCFSQTVNFDALAKYVSAGGGAALLPDKRSANLSLCAFLRGRRGERFPQTAAAYRESQQAFGPDDLFSLLGWLNAQLESLSLPQALAVLRLTRWDPIALLRLFPVITRQLGGAARERSDLRQAVLRTWANRFPVHPDENVLAFDCGVILLELRYFADALPLFQASEQMLGRSAATSYNLGLCALGLGRSDDALAFLRAACELDPDFEPARSSLRKLEGKG